MEQKKTPLSFHVIYWIMNIITGFFALVCVAIIVFYVMLWTDFFGNDLQLHVNLPGKVNYLQYGTLSLMGTDIQVELVCPQTSQFDHFIFQSCLVVEISNCCK